MESLHATDRLGLIDLAGHGHYLQWGIIQVSYANAVVILLMIIVFALALVVPFPGHGDAAGPGRGSGSGPGSGEERADREAGPTA
jgi:hypothetical protein